MTAPLTDADLAAARALAEGASSGPWLTGVLDGPFSPEACARYVENCLNRGVLAEFWFVGCVKPDGAADVCHVGNGPTSPANAEFIAQSRTLVPRLYDAVEEARRERDEAEAIISRAREFVDANGLANGLAGHYGLREVISQQAARAETAERERDEARAAGFRDGAKAMRRAVAAQLRADSDFFTTDVALAVLDATFAQMKRIDIDALLAPAPCATPDCVDGYVPSQPDGEPEPCPSCAKAPCATCGGHGADPMSDNVNWLPCATCGGSGNVKSVCRYADCNKPNEDHGTEPCPACAKEVPRD